MTGATDALHAARYRWRRLDLDDEVDRTHVDAELERRRGHQRAHQAALEVLLDLEALKPRDRAVVRLHQDLTGELVQRAGESFGETPAVDEDERGPMLANQLDEPRVNGRPRRRGAPLSSRRSSARLRG